MACSTQAPLQQTTNILGSATEIHTPVSQLGLSAPVVVAGQQIVSSFFNPKHHAGLLPHQSLKLTLNAETRKGIVAADQPYNGTCCFILLPYTRSPAINVFQMGGSIQNTFGRVVCTVLLGNRAPSGILGSTRLKSTIQPTVPAEFSSMLQICMNIVDVIVLTLHSYRLHMEAGQPT